MKIYIRETRDIERSNFKLVIANIGITRTPDCVQLRDMRDESRKIVRDFRESPGKMSMEMRFSRGREGTGQTGDSTPKTRAQISQQAGVAAADKVITFSTRGLIQILSFNLVRPF